MFRNKDSIEVMRGEVKIEEQDKPYKELIRVTYYKENYWVYNALNEQEKQEPLLMVLRGYINESGFSGMNFKQGDVMKLGRCYFLVQEIVEEIKEEPLEVREDNKLTQNEIDPDDIKVEIALDKDPDEDQVESSMSSERAKNKEEEKDKEAKEALSVSSNEIKCRICLGEDSTKENPIISSPCKCSGSIKFIHADCLKHWLKSKVTEFKNNLYLSYSWKEFECDVCKTKYPGICVLIIEIITCPDGRRIKIISIEKPKKHYMTLKEINNTNSHKIIIILFDKQNTFKIVFTSLNQHRDEVVTVM